MTNLAKFSIIGRIGKVTTLDKVTHISIASDRKVKDKDGNWKTEASWNSVTIFSDNTRKRLENANVSKKGNLVLVEGTLQQNSYEKGGETTYSTTLAVQDFEVLTFAKDSE